MAVLIDGGMEHYRGSFHNKTMYAPLGVSALALMSSLCDALQSSEAPRTGNDRIGMLALATGVIGTGFHFYNLEKRPGGLSWHNLFYAAPVGAPPALSLSGLLRIFATATGRGLKTESSGRALAGLVAASVIGTSAEAGLLHFRGAFHNPAMVIPVAIPPLASAMLARAALRGRRAVIPARWLLRVLSGIGLIGPGFHSYGIQRNMGGWRNWSQNLLNGPPVPTPLAFTALAVAGLAALQLIEGADR